MELLDKVLSDHNLIKAIDKVVKNGGSAGIDGMSVEEGREYFLKHKDEIINKLKTRTYKPQPVKRVEIPKPDGGLRNLGIPCIIDRILQQAINQVLTPIYEKQFCEYSYGFRPNRDAHMAINKSLEYLNEGYNIIVDIDLEKFFDKVNHDKLMQVLNNTIKDGDLLSIIRKYLVSGIMINGVLVSSTEGTPQGGPLSPLLSNVILNELDKELMKRGLRFVCYADDNASLLAINIYVKSIRAGNRVMEGITRFIETKLYLKVNRSKSKVDSYKTIKFLGFGFYYNPRHKQIRVRVHKKSIKRLKNKLRDLTSRRWSIKLEYRLFKIKQVVFGWINYFKLADMRILMIKRFNSLKKLIKIFNLNKTIEEAWALANTRKGIMHRSKSLNNFITNKTLALKGLVSMFEYYTTRINLNVH